MQENAEEHFLTLRNNINFSLSESTYRVKVTGFSKKKTFDR